MHNYFCIGKVTVDLTHHERLQSLNLTQELISVLTYDDANRFMALNLNIQPLNNNEFFYDRKFY